MIFTLIQMAAMILCGVFWRMARPAGLAADQTRQVLTHLVYYLLLPALVLNVLWRADIGVDSLRFTALGFAAVAFGIVAVALVSRLVRLSDPQLGAVMLAASFPNVTYLGLPVLEQTFGPWARSVAIQLDLFATAPLLLTVGVMIARRYGEERGERENLLLSLFRVPSLWAALVAILLNNGGILAPLWLAAFLDKLSAGVVPLMLISLGLGLRWNSLHWRNVPGIVPVVAVKMFLMLFFALWIALHLGFDGDTFVAAVLETAMPCMVLGVVFCDRYRLDTSLYAISVTLTTVLSMATLPLWHQ